MASYLHLTASISNQLDQYTSSPSNGPTVMQNCLFFALVVAVTVTSTYCTCLQTDGHKN